MNDAVPDVQITSTKRSIWDRVSVVWLVPVAALAIALGVAWQTYNDRGPLIEIVFDNAAGIAKDETELRYRDVAVGIVESVKFTETLEQVVVGVRVDKDIAPFVDLEAQFWVVRPEVTTQGVSGLDTVLSGVYLQGNWDEVVSEQAYAFEGLSTPPLLAGDQPGLTILLRSSDGSLRGNTPMLYKGVEVGQVGTANVSSDGFSVEAEAVVYAPYDNLVTRQTRFWDTSGFSLSIGTTGAAVDFESLASLIAGGVTFDTFVSGAVLAEDGHEFTVYADEAASRASIFDRSNGVTLDLMAIFDGNVSGLVTGAAVELNGLRIGEVTGLNGIIEETPSGSNFVRLQTVLSIEPSRLGLDGNSNEEDALQFLKAQVEQGLRARLVTGSLLTGGLKVQLASVANVPPGTIDTNARPFPTIPVTASEFSDVQLTAQSALDRLNELPIEELLQSATDFLGNASVLVGSPETQQVPADVSALLGDIRNVVGDPAVQGLPEQLGSVMADLETTMTEVRLILTAVQEQEVVDRVTRAVDAVAGLSVELETSLQGVPALITEIEALAAKANGLPLDVLTAEIAALSANANALIGTEVAQALPGQIGQASVTLAQTLESVRLLVSDLNADEASTRVLNAVDAVSETAAGLDASLAGLPVLIEQIGLVATEAQGLGLVELTDDIAILVGTANQLIGAQATQALPEQIGRVSGELEATLTEVQGLVSGLNTSAATERLLAAVDAAALTATNLDASLAGVPDLVARISSVAEGAEGMDLAALTSEIQGLVASAETLVSNEATQNLPEDLNAALVELQGLLAALNGNDAVARLLSAVDATTLAANGVSTSVAGVPALIESLNGVAQDAQGLELDVLIEQVSGVLRNADALLAADGTQALPAELTASLAELRGIMAEINDGGAIENTNAALAAARNAADEIAQAAETLPALLNRANALLGQASTTLSGFEETSPALRDARAAIQEITRAAEAVTSLARAIERRPNSLLVGR